VAGPRIKAFWQLHATAYRLPSLNTVETVWATPFAMVRLSRRPVAWTRTHQLLQGTPHRSRPALQHVRVDHCGLEIGVPEELLDGTYVRALLQQVRGK
jgi:hypothetical protein